MDKLTRDEKKKLKALEKKFGARFWNRDLLKQALTHRSYLPHSKKNRLHYERLEFLGDSVLGLVVSDILMERYPEISEGELSKIRSSLVNEKTLASFARTFDLGSYVYLSRGEEAGNGRDRPALLADVYEAVLGGVYLDRGFKKVSKLIRSHFEDLCKQVGQENSFQDYKSELQEKVQALLKINPTYQLLEMLGPDHGKMFKVQLLIREQVYGVGEGKNKKQAEQNAAQAALEKVLKEGI